MAAAPTKSSSRAATTEGINLVAQAWGNANLKPGDVILLTENGAPSNLVPWQMLATRTGAKLAFIPVTGDEGVLDLTRLDAFAHARSELLSLVHISNSMGTVNPVADLWRPGRKTRHPPRSWMPPKAPATCRRCAGHRLRLPRLLRPQDLRPDRHRRAFWAHGIWNKPRRGRAAAR